MQAITDKGVRWTPASGAKRKMMAPWMERHLGKQEMDVLRALKKHFDPKGIMNPGGTLGLDLPPNP